mgnify:CR=1 FL=1
MLVRFGTYGSLQIQAEHPDGVAQFQIGRLQVAGFFRLFRFCLFPVEPVHLLTEFRSFLFHLADGDAFFSEFLEVAHGLVGIVLGVSENGFRFFRRLSDDFVPPFVEAFPFFGQAAFQFFHFLAGTAEFFLLFFHRDPVLFQSGQDVLKGFILLADLFLCLFNNVIRQSQLAGNSERVALPGNADEQTVSGT